MSQFYMTVYDMLDYYGIDINVYQLPKPKRVAGVWQKPKLADIKPEARHEPVLPASSNTSFLAQFLTGGADITGSLIWLSTGDYPVDMTIVEVPDQEGKRFKVTAKSSYKGYSDLRIYQLKEDDRSPDAE